MKNIKNVDSCQNCQHCLFQTIFDDEDAIQCNINDQYMKWFEAAEKTNDKTPMFDADRYILPLNTRRIGDDLYRVGSTLICDLWEKRK